jgi:phosphatidate phosphatase APP1
LKDSSFRALFEDPLTYKLNAIEPLIKDFPDRKFILVGDSGEKDPEAYATLARYHPAQVLSICIRDVTDEPADSPRYREAFRDVPPAKWQLFRDPATLDWPSE